MTLTVTPIEAPTGAQITGVDLGTELDDTAYGAIHKAWLDYQVLVFPGQTMTEEDQIRFATHWGEMPLRSRYTGRREEDSRRLEHPGRLSPADDNFYRYHGRWRGISAAAHHRQQQ